MKKYIIYYRAEDAIEIEAKDWDEASRKALDLVRQKHPTTLHVEVDDVVYNGEI